MLNEKRQKDGFLATRAVPIPLAHNKTALWKLHFVQLKLTYHLTTHKKNSLYTSQRTVTGLHYKDQLVDLKNVLFNTGSTWQTLTDCVGKCGCVNVKASCADCPQSVCFTLWSLIDHKSTGNFPRPLKRWCVLLQSAVIYAESWQAVTSTYC